MDQLRGRVRLYVQVFLALDIAAYLSNAVMPLFISEMEAQELPLAFAIVRHSVTVALVAAWSFARFARPSRNVLVALEIGVTAGLLFAYIHLGMAYMGEARSFGPFFTLLGVALLLVVRASLVPSPVTRTAIIGVAALTWWIVVSREQLSLDPLALDGLTFMGGAFVVATSVTSHVIYGLQRQVRHAKRLGQYELGRKIGEGGMGIVYQATHVMLRRPTAVKLLPVDKAGEHTIARFEREVQQTSRLEHPNSVQIYDYGRTPDGQFYYAMEYLDGVTLEQLVEMDGPISVARAAKVLLQAARALAEAHGMGLVHRDVKPANIMLCERARVPDTVKVLDYGLVKELDNPEVGDGITQGNTIIGTPHYLAPESITSPDDVGPPADVYALGAIAFYLVTGREVFTGATVIEVCSSHLNTAPERPSSVLGSEIDPAFERLILRCLEKQPDDRPRDGAQLAGALEELDLPGWSSEDAEAWWRDYPSRRAATAQREPMQPTQLEVDVEGRR